MDIIICFVSAGDVSRLHFFVLRERKSRADARDTRAEGNGAGGRGSGSYGLTPETQGWNVAEKFGGKEKKSYLCRRKTDYMFNERRYGAI